MAWKYRYTVLSVLFCTYLVCYLDRMVMATAIPFIAEEFHLSSVAMGGVLSAFFVGYALMQIPGGVLADKFGSRIVLSISAGWWSIMTIFTGLATGATSLMGIRVLFGLGEGSFPPAAAKALSIWFPPREVGRANGLQLASSYLGATLAPLFAVALIHSWGWRAVFIALSPPGILLALAVWRIVLNSPADCKNPPVQIPVTESLSQAWKIPAVRWTAACLFLTHMLAWGLMNWLPTYLLRARGFEIDKMAAMTALTTFAGAIGYPVGGFLCDRFFRENLRLPIVAGLLISGSLVYLAASAPSGDWAVGFFVLQCFISTITGAMFYTLPLIVAPKCAVGGAYGIINTAGQSAGLVSPIFIGYLLDATGGDFQLVLYCLIGFVFAAIFPASQIRQAPKDSRL